MLSLARVLQLAPLLALTTASTAKRGLNSTTYVFSLPTYAQDLFTESMSWMDGFYDPSAGYLFDESSAASLRHETRSSAWYAIGLLARNEGSDVDDSLEIITNVISGQFKDPADQWWVVSVAIVKIELTKFRYGDYQKEPEEPTVGSAAYPENIYNSWDPNWRGFIGTAFIVGLEEFPDLITPSFTALILESLYNNTKGDEYRVGGVDNDNLYPAYTNPVSS